MQDSYAARRRSITRSEEEDIVPKGSETGRRSIQLTLALAKLSMIEKPRDTDRSAILDLLKKAFYPSEEESSLIHNLWTNGKISNHYVVRRSGTVVGYLAYTGAYDVDRNRIGFHLAPVAVLPEFQNQGIGTELIQESLKRFDPDEPVYVLGEPRYYARFGFCIDKSQSCKYDSAGDHFQVLTIRKLREQRVEYEDAFDG